VFYVLGKVESDVAELERKLGKIDYEEGTAER